MRFFRTTVEKDTESFLRNLMKLKPMEFIGVARLLEVRTSRDPKKVDICLDDYAAKSEEEKEKIKDALLIPAEEIVVKMIDRFAALDKKKRKEILRIVKIAAGG